MIPHYGIYGDVAAGSSSSSSSGSCVSISSKINTIKSAHQQTVFNSHMARFALNRLPTSSVIW